MPAKRILLDTDLAMGQPGSDIDDGFALALALADPGLRVELVTTVNGNTDVDTATRLTLQLLARLGRADVAVARGAATPLVGDWSRGTGTDRTDPPGPDPRPVAPHCRPPSPTREGRSNRSLIQSHYKSPSYPDHLFFLLQANRVIA